MLFCSACQASTTTQQENLGLSVDDWGFREIHFCIYHSNAEDHRWELLHTYVFSPDSEKKQQYVDVHLSSRGEVVTIHFETKHIVQEGNSETIKGEELNHFDIAVPGLTKEMPYGYNKPSLQKKRKSRFLLCSLSLIPIPLLFSRIFRYKILMM